MRRKFSFLVTLWWVILCGVIGACMMFFANRTPVISELENRTLSGMPAFSLDTMQKGEISEQFESFLTDQFFLRSELVDGANTLKHLFSVITVDELLEVEGQEVFIPENAPSQPDEQVSSSPAADVEEEPQPAKQENKPNQEAVTTGDTSYVWLNHKDGSRDAIFTYDKIQIQKAADVFNLYAALLPVGGKVHVLLAPRAQTANKLALHLDTESGWSSEVESVLQSLVSSNVVIHNAYDIFRRRDSQWRIYLFSHGSSLDRAWGHILQQTRC